jgi:hypothetical protein
MRMLVTVDSQNERLLGLVRDFAVGLGFTAERGSPSQVAVSLPQASDETLLHLLTHVALSATKSGVEPGEPICQVTFQEDGAPSEVRLGLRIASFDLQSPKKAKPV